MGHPIDFAGTNLVLVPAEGTEDRVTDMRVFSNGTALVSCWKLSPAEVAEINATGRVYVAMLTFGHRPPPVYAGDEASTRAVVEDFGGAWSRPAEAGQIDEIDLRRQGLSATPREGGPEGRR